MSSPNLPIVTVMLFSALAGCSPRMYDQPRYETYEDSPLIERGLWMRRPPVGTVPRRDVTGDPFRGESGNLAPAVGGWKPDEALLNGTSGGQFVEQIPLPLTAEVMHRGRQRYDIHCSVCHDRVGTGRGMVVQRGFPRPPSLHEPRLRNAPAGKIFAVITHGFKRMPSYESSIVPRDRWAIVAYVRALQQSQHTELSEAPESIRRQFEK